MASKASIEAGRGHVTLGVKDELVAGLEKAKGTFKAWGASVAAIGAVVAAGGAAISAPFLGGLHDLAETSHLVFNAARITGMSFDQVQTTAAGMRVSVEELAPAVVKMNTFLMKAGESGSAASEELERLHLHIGDLNSMTEHDRMLALADAISKVGDEARRTSLVREIFGRQGQALNISGGRAGIESRAARFREIGGVISDDDIAKGKEYWHAQKEAGIATAGIYRVLGAIAAPVMTEIAQRTLEVIMNIRGWVDANRPLLDIIFRVGFALATAGAAIVALGGVIYGVSYAISFMTGALAILKGGFGLVSVASALWGAMTLGASLVASAAVAGFNVVLLLFSGGASLVTGILSIGMWVALKLVAVGFGLIALGSLAAKAAMWLYAMAMAGGAVSAVAAAVGAKIYTVGAAAASIATTILTAGINLLIGALVVVAAAYAAAALMLPLFPIAGVAVLFGLAAAAAVGFAANSLYASGAVGRAWDATTASLDRAFGEMYGAGYRAFVGLQATAVTAFSGIKSAISAGDWALAWEILSVAAELAFLDISTFAKTAWVTIKFTAFDVWNAVTDFVEDSWAALWLDAQLTFAQFLIWWGTEGLNVFQVFFSKLGDLGTEWNNAMLMGFGALIVGFAVVERTIREAIVGIAMQISTSLGNQVARLLGVGDGAAGRTVVDGARAEIEALRGQVRGAVGGAMDIGAIRRQAEADRAAREADRAARDAQLEERRTIEAQLAEGGGADREALQTRLRNLEISAAFGDMMAEVERQMALERQLDGGQRGGEGELEKAKFGVSGSFSAAVIAGFIGAASGAGETRGEREARLNREAAEQAVEILRDLQRRPGWAMG